MRRRHHPRRPRRLESPAQAGRTIALISPSDDLQLSAALRQQMDWAHVPVLTVPPVLDRDGVPDPPGTGGLLSRFERRARSWPAYDRGAVKTRIRESLEQSAADRETARILLDAASHPAA